MAPTDFDYLATRNEIIEGAFRIVGVIEHDQSPTADMLSQGIKALQLLVKSWKNKNLFLWSLNQATFPTISSQADYDTEIDQAILGLDKAWVVSDDQDVPIEVVSWSRYLDIPDKEATGRPTTIALKPTPAPTFYLYPVPDAIYTVKALCVFPLKDLDLAAGSGDIPAEFQRALKYGLAEDLYDEYPGAMNSRQYIQMKAAELFREAKNSNGPRETTNEVEGLYGNDR